jgi:hypothetical protein
MYEETTQRVYRCEHRSSGSERTSFSLARGLLRLEAQHLTGTGEHALV